MDAVRKLEIDIVQEVVLSKSSEGRMYRHEFGR